MNTYLAKAFTTELDSTSLRWFLYMFTIRVMLSISTYSSLDICTAEWNLMIELILAPIANCALALIFAFHQVEMFRKLGFHIVLFWCTYFQWVAYNVDWKFV
uniref:Uncharacterized protein n=1 Tax=Oryza brachyantha TaxID=4533 RepID=J3L0K9_ORYBR